MDGRRQRLFVVDEPGSTPAAMGRKVAERSDLDDIAARQEAAGIAGQRGTRALAGQRFVEDLIAFDDPDGKRVELVHNPMDSNDPFVPGRPISGFRTGGLDRAAAFADAPDDHALSEVAFAPVIPDPDKIVCVGLNYHAQVQETGRTVTPHPALFARYAGSQVGHGVPLVKPLESDEFDYEGEVAVIIGKGGRRIPEGEALSHVAGYGCYNDASVRDWQRHTPQFMPGKTFAGTGGFGPWMVSTDELPDPTALTLSTRLNGQEVQHTGVGLMNTPIPALIAYISTILPAAARGRDRLRHARRRRRQAPAAALHEGWGRGRGERHRPPAQHRRRQTLSATAHARGPQRSARAALRMVDPIPIHLDGEAPGGNLISRSTKRTFRSPPSIPAAGVR